MGEQVADRIELAVGIRGKVDGWIKSILPRFVEARDDARAEAEVEEDDALRDEHAEAVCALVDQWTEVADRYGAESAPALGVLLALVRATGIDENGEQTIEIHIGPEGFTVEVLWFDEDGGDNVEYWDLGEALVSALLEAAP